MALGIPLRCIILLAGAAAAVAGGAAEDAGPAYYPAGSCVSSCDAEHKCLSDACTER